IVADGADILFHIAEFLRFHEVTIFSNYQNLPINFNQNRPIKLIKNNRQNLSKTTDRFCIQNKITIFVPLNNDDKYGLFKTCF
ncbi:MAG: hypothetical protein K2K11_06050, partial [Bacteroidales bacterium]|nr:hypothetical protein [Bacteroidales bacterium]